MLRIIPCPLLPLQFGLPVMPTNIVWGFVAEGAPVLAGSNAMVTGCPQAPPSGIGPFQVLPPSVVYQREPTIPLPHP